VRLDWQASLDFLTRNKSNREIHLNGRRLEPSAKSTRHRVRDVKR
jgi:hypothetical protein